MTKTGPKLYLFEMDELDILKKAKVIAVLGASTDPGKVSNRITKYLISKGYRVYPINPNHIGGEIAGAKVLGSLCEVPEPIDVIDVFRKSESVEEIVDDLINCAPKTVWLQLGIVAPKCERKLCDKGIKVVSNKCVYQVLEENEND